MDVVDEWMDQTGWNPRRDLSALGPGPRAFHCGAGGRADSTSQRQEWAGKAGLLFPPRSLAGTGVGVDGWKGQDQKTRRRRDQTKPREGGAMLTTNL
jgi:hypothetical protein